MESGNRLNKHEVWHLQSSTPIGQLANATPSIGTVILRILCCSYALIRRLIHSREGGTRRNLDLMKTAENLGSRPAIEILCCLAQLPLMTGEAFGFTFGSPQRLPSGFRRLLTLARLEINLWTPTPSSFDEEEFIVDGFTGIPSSAIVQLFGAEELHLLVRRGRWLFASRRAFIKVSSSRRQAFSAKLLIRGHDRNRKFFDSC